MVVGQTGSGKTTLLNAYINYLMGINYEDDFRYLMIHEQFNKKQDESQTSEVTIYNIRAPDGTNNYTNYRYSWIWRYRWN